MKENNDASRIASRRVFDVALLEFGSKGYELTSLDEIAKRAGVNKEYITEHFNSKYDLFVDVLKDLASRYFLGEKNYKSVENFFLRSVKRIKEMSEKAQPILDFLIQFSYTMNFFPKDVTKRVEIYLQQTDAYKLLSESFEERGIKENPFKVITTFIRASSAMTKIYVNSGLGLPADEVYLEPFREYIGEKKDTNQSEFKGEVNTGLARDVIQTDENVGSFAIEMGTGFAPRMYADKAVLKMFGFEDGLTPESL